MKGTFETSESDKARWWPRLIVGLIILFMIWLVAPGSALIWPYPVGAPLHKGYDCWYFTGTGIASFDAPEFCPLRRYESRGMFQ